MDYQSTMVIVLAAILGLAVVRFAVPRLQTACVAGLGIVAVLAAFVPGAPTWQRVSGLTVAVMTVALLLARPSSGSRHRER